MRSIWIYSLSEKASESIQPELLSSVNEFLSDWKAHGSPISSGSELKYGQFVIIRAEKGDTSGCSIDSMNRNLNSIFQKFGLRALESNHVFYKAENGEVKYFDFRDAEKLIQAGELTTSTIMFDNSIEDRDDFGNWEKPISESWLSRYFQPA